jgi:hypothetical protein
MNKRNHKTSGVIYVHESSVGRPKCPPPGNNAVEHNHELFMDWNLMTTIVGCDDAYPDNKVGFRCPDLRT